jgi:transcription antitermination factor NusG
MSASIGPQNHNTLSWYALRVRSRYETAASLSLANKGYEEFLPKYQSTRRWSDRTKQLQQPLFPGYLFCRLNIHERLLPVLTTPGVVCIVGAGSTPIPVSEVEIAAIQSVIRSGLAAQPYPYLAAGARVLIERGPLKGLEGLVRSAENFNMDQTCSLVVSVSLLQRSIAVEIQRDWVRVISNIGDPGVSFPPSSKRRREAPGIHTVAAHAGSSS